MKGNLVTAACAAALAAATLGAAASAQVQTLPSGTPPYQGPPAGMAPGAPPGMGPRLGVTGCEGAATRVARTICGNTDLVALDRDVARLAGEGADHAAWRRSLDACNTVPESYSGRVYNCLRPRYEARLVQLARRAGGERSGTYGLLDSPHNGRMTIVEWPEGRTTIMFGMVTADGARTCGLRVDAPARGNVITGSPEGLPGCRISVALEGRVAAVRSNDCQSMCEMGTRVDGTYRLGN